MKELNITNSDGFTIQGKAPIQQALKAYWGAGQR